MEYKKTAQATIDLIGNKIMNVSQNSQQNNSETVPNNLIKKNLSKDIYLQKKDRKLLII